MRISETTAQTILRRFRATSGDRGWMRRPGCPDDARHGRGGVIAAMLALTLAACHAPTAGNTAQPDPALVNAEAAANTQAVDDDGRILCATGGAATMTRTCTVDRETSPRGLVLTLHHADGGFHRLLVTTDGHGVMAADGAQGATVTVVGTDEIEVKIGADRYRLPATVGKRKA
ncbi:MAG: hypothetical protein ACRYFW_07450 [Janthinobacterium lividum]